MKKRIKVFFTDFWSVFEIDNNFFLSLLDKEYDVEISDNNPDFLFYSVFGNSYQKYNCTRIFYTGENIRPDFTECDYAFTFDFKEGNPRHYRLPLYPFFDDIHKLLNKRTPEEILKEKTAFCNFIYSNPGPKKRVEFFKKLSKYKKVDSGGRFLNNIGGRVGDKKEFTIRYKFTIAFENESFPGYTTEKIFEPMLVDSLPVYWGNPLVHLDFNRKSFLNYHDYESDEALIERIIEVDRNDDLYIQYLREPYFENNRVNKFVDYNNILNQLIYIVNNKIEPVASNDPAFSNNSLISFYGKNFNKARYLKKEFSRRWKFFNLYKVKMKAEKFIKS